MTTSPPGLHRRALFAMAAGASAATLTRAQAAESGPPDVGVYCEPTLKPAIAAAGLLFKAAHGGPVAVLTAPAGLILAQIKQNQAHDLLIVPAAAMDQAAERKFIDPSTRRDAWRDALVVACRAGEPAGEPDIARLLATGTIAATDATPAASLDGMAVLDRLGLTTLLHGRVMGVPNTADAAFQVRTGAARYALVFLTDVRADPSLAVAAVLDPAKAPPVTYAVALNTKPPHRNARPFLDFLDTAEANAKLRQLGLETT